MRSIIKLAVLAAVMISLLGTGWVSYSAQKQCPVVVPPTKALNDQQFMSVHGLSQQNMSLWMREYSIKHMDNNSPVPQECGSIKTAPAAEGK